MEAPGGFLPSFVRMLVPAVGPQIRVRPLCWPRHTAGGRLRSGILRHVPYCRLGPVDGYRPLGRLKARTRHDPVRDGRTRMVQARRLGQLSVRHGLWRKAGPRQYPFGANAPSLRGLDAWKLGAPYAAWRSPRRILTKWRVVKSVPRQDSPNSSPKPYPPWIKPECISVGDD